MARYGFSTIEHFADRSFLKSPGLLRPSRFKLIWDLPSALHTGLTMLTENVQGVVTPGFSVETSTLPLRIGVTRRRIESIRVTFYESQNLDLRTYFYKWMAMAAQHESQDKNFAMEYPRSYMAILSVKNLRTDGAEGSGEKFTDVFPTGVAELTHDVSQDEELASIIVTFAYRFHELI